MKRPKQIPIETQVKWIAVYSYIGIQLYLVVSYLLLTFPLLSYKDIHLNASYIGIQVKWFFLVLCNNYTT